MLDRDKLNSTPSATAARSTFMVLDRVQDLQPEAQVIAVGSMLKLLAEHHGLSPQDIMGVVDNLMHEDGDRHPDFAAIQEYMRHELP